MTTTTAVHWSAIVPPEEVQYDLHAYLTGHRAFPAADWAERIEREANPGRRELLEATAEREAANVRATSAAFLAVIAKMLGSLPGVELQTEDGTPVEIASLDISGTERFLPWHGRPPRLRGSR